MFGHLARSMGLLMLVWLSVVPGPVRSDDGPAQSPIEVDNWSIWVGGPSQTAFNATRVYQNAMPSSVGTSRPKLEAKDLESRFPIAPISIVQFFGSPAQDVDIELRLEEGSLLAHWPPSKEQSGRMRWFGSSFSATAPAEAPLAHLPEDHWFQALRAVEPSLFLKNKPHAERFLAVDAELVLPVPLKVRGGPDKYTLQNLTASPLRHVAIIAPTNAGLRVGWLDELPTAVPKKEDQPSKKPEAAPKSEQEQREALFADASKETKEPEDQLRPLPAEGDANVRAQVDQRLNRPVTISSEKAPLENVLGLIVGQARLRLEMDGPAVEKSKIDLKQAITPPAAGTAARDALADLLGNAGLSFRITQAGTLLITTAERLTEGPAKQGAVIEGPPLELTLSQPLKASEPSYRELTLDSYRRRLTSEGLREEVIDFIIAQYGKALFEPKELIVLAHLSPDVIDEAVTLDVFPPPKKLVRTAVLVLHGLDPRLQDRARALVEQLGDKSAKARDAAEAQLFELGAVTVPALEDALNSKDVEIVYRAERLLMRLNRPVP